MRAALGPRSLSLTHSLDNKVARSYMRPNLNQTLTLLLILNWWHWCLTAFAGTYFTHEAKGADDAVDADTAIINAEGGHSNTDEKKEYYI